MFFGEDAGDARDKRRHRETETERQKRKEGEGEGRERELLAASLIRVVLA